VFDQHVVEQPKAPLGSGRFGGEFSIGWNSKMSNSASGRVEWPMVNTTGGDCFFTIACGVSTRA
jgi:hypothetical protein